MAYEESAQSCRKAYLDELRPVSPTLATLTEAAYARNQDSLSGLMQKTLSWGQYIQGVVGSYRELSLKVAAELKRLANASNSEQRAGE
jgi:hypothetical protein